MIDTTTGLPYTGDAPASAGEDPFAGMVPGRAIGRMGNFAAGKAPGKAPGEGAAATAVTPSATQSIYTPPVLYTSVPPVATESIYTPPPRSAPSPGPIQFVPPEQTWIPGVPNIVTGVTALALGYALYKTFFEAPRTNPSAPAVQGFLARHAVSAREFDAHHTAKGPRVRVRGISKSGMAWLGSKAAQKSAHVFGLRYHLGLVDDEAIFEDMNARKNPTHWVKDGVYRTSYGTARVIKLEGDGTFATFRIESPTREAGGMGWRRGDTFGANVNDNTSPSPSTWERIDDARGNPNNRGRPTLKEVESAFGDSLRHEYGDKAVAKAKAIHAALQRGNALQEINDIVHGHGVEDFIPNGDDDPAAIYINMGDLYNMTVIWDVKRRVYVLTDMGTWRSENES